jgi:hypothetical protein
MDIAFEKIIKLTSEIKLRRLRLDKENLQSVIRTEREIYDLSSSEDVRKRALSVISLIAKEIVRIDGEIKECISVLGEKKWKYTQWH